VKIGDDIPLKKKKISYRRPDHASAPSASDGRCQPVWRDAAVALHLPASQAGDLERTLLAGKSLKRGRQNEQLSGNLASST
jgi:hypothetical protein